MDLLLAAEYCSRPETLAASNNSQHFLDPYSLTHVLLGIFIFWLIALVLPRLAADVAALALAVTIFRRSGSSFEKLRFLLFSVIAKRHAALGYQGDTVVNSLGRHPLLRAGFMIARRLGLRRSVLAFLVTRLSCCYGSVIVCCWRTPHAGPSNWDALKDWQMCR